ncbi:MAG: TonB-dependent receptor [Bacteroidetes bacterium]|nr:MAG: TonB-dependent receptor [Bacteroidota bacterium]
MHCIYLKARTWLQLLLMLSVFGALHSASAQNGVISGLLYNEINRNPLPFGTILLQGTPYGTYTDSAGRFEIRNLPPGLYNLEARYNGFEPVVLYEIQLSNSKPQVLEIGMKEKNVAIDSVNIVASPFKQPEESPLSLRTIGTNEIKRYPGGNRDISRVIQALPGVASTISFRNDILIRGGAPNENRFYLDGIETPNINHFATQGASGGPVGMINVDFIGEVDVYSGAFPANRGNALSSVFEFRQRPARNDRLGFTATVGASDLALTLEGPAGQNGDFLFSARRSYLQLLFKALKLPFLPTYNDFQYKQTIRPGQRHEIKVVGLGAIDEFALNTDANETAYQRYLLNNLPVNTQWNYTIGTSYKYFGDEGFWTLVLSRNMINFNTEKFEDNDPANTQLLDYRSQESENKLRLEYTGRKKGFKWNAGINFEWVRYTTDTYNQTRFGLIDFETRLNFAKYGAFVQVSRQLLQDRLSLSLGTRMDGNSFSAAMRNPLEQFSPRFSASFRLTPAFSLNANAGIFYQLPPYTILGYRDSRTQALVNTSTTYIRNKQLVAGMAYQLPTNTRLSVEAYYKRYDRYPFLLRDSVSLANLGGDFGVIGNEPAVSVSEGRTYGLEVLVQQRLYQGFYGILAYTLGWSEFTDKEGRFVPSSWDSRHIISITGGKKFGGNWEVGARWRFQSGTPYTPADVATSSLISVWDLRGQAVPDYEQLNSRRIRGFHQLDVRVDKKWFFERWSLNLFLDVQNVYGYRIPGPPVLSVQENEQGQPLVSADDPARYATTFLENDIGIVQPTLGVVITF